MLTFIKEILTWWNRQTFGTRLQTIFFGKFVGEDEFGNKYYENKKINKRWVIYKGEIEATTYCFEFGRRGQERGVSKEARGSYFV